MLKPHFVKATFLSLVWALAGLHVHAQAYRHKPIRILTSGVGGGNDFVARLIAPGLAGRVRQQVIVENRASLFIPGETVAHALPDGYTLLLAGGAFLMGPLLQKSLELNDHLS